MLKVDIENISRKDGDKFVDVLTNVHFSILPGKVYTILGKNGSGKSTLIKSLTNLLNKNIFTVDGKVLFENDDILTMTEQKLQSLRRKRIRYVLQDLTNNFDPLKKLKYYLDIIKTDEIKLNSLLKDFLLPDYKNICELYPYEISGGMAQRVSFLLAVLPNPKLLILDEPTSAIDYANINLIKVKLDEYKTLGNSALIVTQDIQFAKEISDEISFLSNQTLTEFKLKDSFFAQPEQNYSNFLKAYHELK